MSGDNGTTLDLDAAALARYEQSIMATFGAPQRVLARGEGSYVWDVDGNQYLDLLGGIAVTALGHAHPGWVQAIASQAADTGSVHVVFTEDVVGISATSAPVYASRPLFDHGNPVAGSWQCADLNGATADCLRGPVRTAVFVADQPFPASYSGPVAVVNPEHVLDVTDLAGNPAGDARRIG